MRRLLLAAFIAVVAQSAHAAEPADLPVLRGAYTEPAPAPVRRIWQGFYAGGQFGYSSHDFDFSNTTVGLQQYLVRESIFAESVGKWQLLGSANQPTFGFGGFIGYNAQFENVIIGVEGNYTHNANSKRGESIASLSRVQANPTGSNPPAGHSYEYTVTLTGDASARVNDVMTLRARGGYTMGSFVPYIFAGLAAGLVDISRSAKVSVDQVDIWTDVAQVPHRDFLGTTVASKSESHKNLLAFGFTGGFGFEYMLMSNIFVRAEWEYAQFTTPKDTIIQLNTGRAGVGYKF